MFQKNPFLVFCIKLLGSYAIWKLLYYVLETQDPAVWEVVKNYIASKTVACAAWMDTHLFQMDIRYNARNILIEGKRGVFLADHCIGIPAYVVFTLFIIFYSGRWQDKVWFIPVGIVGIFLINSLRSAALAYLQKNSSEGFFQFNHSYTYLVTTYGMIFLFIVWWVEVYARGQSTELLQE